MTTRYEIEELVTDYCYLAWDQELEQEVFVKEASTASFKKEVEILKTCLPFLPVLIDAYSVDGKNFIVTKPVPGVSLADYTPRKSEAHEISTKLTQAIQSIHRCGFWHGDLKLSHIYWNKDFRTIYIIDFGLSEPGRCSPTSITPEHDPHANVPLGPWSDIPALGRILEHLTANNFSDCYNIDIKKRPSLETIKQRLVAPKNTSIVVFAACLFLSLNIRLVKGETLIGELTLLKPYAIVSIDEASSFFYSNGTVFHIGDMVTYNLEPAKIVDIDRQVLLNRDGEYIPIHIPILNIQDEECWFDKGIHVSKGNDFNKLATALQNEGIGYDGTPIFGTFAAADKDEISRKIAISNPIGLIGYDGGPSVYKDQLSGHLKKMARALGYSIDFPRLPGGTYAVSPGVQLDWLISEFGLGYHIDENELVVRREP